MTIRHFFQFLVQEMLSGHQAFHWFWIQKTHNDHQTSFIISNLENA